MQTHETYLAQVRDAIMQTAPLTDEERRLLDETKMVYGSGAANLRGITFYNRWRNGADHSFVEISAFGQESPCQLAGTLAHEFGHVLAGPAGAHQKPWRLACERLGLRRAKAVGHHYLMAGFRPALRERLAHIEPPAEGLPVPGISGLGTLIKIKPCTFGKGSMGGRLRQPTRMLKYTCGCEPPVIIRHCGEDLAARCEHCDRLFRQPLV